jgi:hypothetical protein
VDSLLRGECRLDAAILRHHHVARFQIVVHYTLSGAAALAIVPAIPRGISASSACLVRNCTPSASSTEWIVTRCG